MTKYYIAKLGDKNSLAEDYLAGNTDLKNKKPAIPIYYERKPSKKEDLLNDSYKKKHPQRYKQCKNFFDCGEHNGDKIIVILHAGEVYFVKPIGNVIFANSIKKPGWNGYVKLLPIRIIKTFPIADVPPILASITANRYYGSGTFREIKHAGNITAIEVMLGSNEIKRSKLKFKQQLECLCSTQLETLVAKLFEDAGCFVPAYRGGQMKDADLFAHNDTNNPISLGMLTVPPKEGVSIQVKSNSTAANPPQGVNFLVGVDIKQGKRNFDSNWLYTMLKSEKSQRTKDWFDRSLSWLP